MKLRRYVKWTCRLCNGTGHERQWFWQNPPQLCDTRAACLERFYMQDPVLQLAITLLPSQNAIVQVMKAAGMHATDEEMAETLVLMGAAFTPDEIARASLAALPPQKDEWPAAERVDNGTYHRIPSRGSHA